MPDVKYYNYKIKRCLIWGIMFSLAGIGLFYRLIESYNILVTGTVDGDPDIMLTFSIFLIALALPVGIGCLLGACKAHYYRSVSYQAYYPQTFGSKKLNILDRIGKVTGINFWVPFFLVALVTISGSFMVTNLAKLPEIGKILLVCGVIVLVVATLVLCLCIKHDRKEKDG